MKTFYQIETRVQNPPAMGWYNTDKGLLYYFYNFMGGNAWSSRDDIISEEYPNFWYQDAELEKSTMIMKAGYRLQQYKVETLTKDLDAAEKGRMIFTLGYVDFLMKNWRLNPHSEVNRWRTPEEIERWKNEITFPLNEGLLDHEVYFRYLIYLAKLSETEDVNK